MRPGWRSPATGSFEHAVTPAKGALSGVAFEYPDLSGWGHQIDADYAGPWEIPVLGPVPAPNALLIRPDGYVAWVGEGPGAGLGDALNAWLGPPAP